MVSPVCLAGATGGGEIYNDLDRTGKNPANLTQRIALTASRRSANTCSTSRRSRWRIGAEFFHQTLMNQRITDICGQQKGIFAHAAQHHRSRVATQPARPASLVLATEPVILSSGHWAINSPKLPWVLCLSST